MPSDKSNFLISSFISTSHYFPIRFNCKMQNTKIDEKGIKTTQKYEKIYKST